ncbi:Development/cell death domain [Arabidopsis suecica]|uniref:Development/cell death domain n=1 Tax=Arabidopsis suecica TaxID=45249 RepID=A0A8T2DJE4_ARASU|nr:Development/cell death domain [Arabidopsis suecica]
MEYNNNNQQSFWQFSDQLRVQTPNLANLSLNDSIWSTNSVFKERRNLDIAATTDKNNNQIDYYQKKTTSDNINSNWNWKSSGSNNDIGLGFGPVGSKSTVDLNPIDKFNSPFNDTWKFNSVNVNVNGYSPSSAVNGDFNKGVYTSMKKYGYNVNLKNNNKNKGIDEDHQIQKGGKKNRKNQQNNNNQRNEDDKNNGLDKRFKTLPPAEALPRNETIGGYIFVCNNDTMEENLKRQLFGLPPRYRDSVRAITPGLPLFLYNYSTHQLHGIYEAASFGGTNIELNAFEDKKCPGESRFPAQVRAITRKVCLPLEEDSFRPILHHYDGPKFRLELSVPEVLSLLDIFADQNP